MTRLRLTSLRFETGGLVSTSLAIPSHVFMGSPPIQKFQEPFELSRVHFFICLRQRGVHIYLPDYP